MIPLLVILMIQLSIIKQDIRENEGFRIMPYFCPANKLTVGYGFNMDYLTEKHLNLINKSIEDINKKGMNKPEAELILDIKVKQLIEDVGCFVDLESLTEARQLVMLDMCYQMGRTRFGKFKLMLRAVADKDWERAADEIIDSEYYGEMEKLKSVRAKRNVKMMRTGEL